jgi:hypothetical protein
MAGKDFLCRSQDIGETMLCFLDSFDEGVDHVYVLCSGGGLAPRRSRKLYCEDDRLVFCDNDRMLELGCNRPVNCAQ